MRLEGIVPRSDCSPREVGKSRLKRGLTAEEGS